jgi:MFS family permease
LLQLGPNIGILLLARTLQGISAAVVWVVGLALLADTIPRGELGQAMGIVLLAMTLGVVIGPLFGGFVFDRAGYDAVFIMAYVFIGADVALRLMMVERTPIHPSTRSAHPSYVSQDSLETTVKVHSREIAKIDIEMTVLSDKNWPTSVDFTEQVPQLPREKPTPPIRKRPKTPAMFTLIRSGRQLCCLWGVMVTAILACQFDSVLPIYVKNTFSWSSTAAGLIFLPVTLTAFLSPVVGWAVDRYGPRWITVSGFISLALFEVLLSLVIHNTLGQKVLLAVLLGLIGVSFCLTTTPLLVEVTDIVEAKEAEQPGIFGANGAIAQAYGLFNFAWALGSLVGPLWAGLVNQRVGWTIMSWSLALLSLVSSIPMLIWTGGLIPEFERRLR